MRCQRRRADYPYPQSALGSRDSAHVLPLDNLTLATPRLNRNEKGARDAAEWLPARNRCWFAATIVAVRREYDLTIDQREAAVLDTVLRECDTDG